MSSSATKILLVILGIVLLAGVVTMLRGRVASDTLSGRVLTPGALEGAQPVVVIEEPAAGGATAAIEEPDEAYSADLDSCFALTEVCSNACSDVLDEREQVTCFSACELDFETCLEEQAL